MSKPDFQNGFALGRASGGVVEVDAHYEEFWDTYQDTGNRTSYNYAFGGLGWNDVTFKPKYDITPKGSVMYLFAASHITDLKSILDSCGVTLDFSQVTQVQYPFQNSKITRIGVLNVSNCSSLPYFLHNANELIEIEKLVLKSDGSQTFNATFSFGECKALKRMIVEGCIGQNNFDVHQSTNLDKESIESIINALSSTTEGLTATLSLTAVNTSFETTEGAGNGSASDEWLNLIATKSNWTITLS